MCAYYIITAGVGRCERVCVVGVISMMVRTMIGLCRTSFHVEPIIVSTATGGHASAFCTNQTTKAQESWDLAYDRRVCGKLSGHYFPTPATYERTCF